MKIKLIGMGEANVYEIGNVKREDIVEVSEELGASLCAQVGMWENVDQKQKKEGK